MNKLLGSFAAFLFVGCLSISGFGSYKLHEYFHRERNDWLESQFARVEAAEGPEAARNLRSTRESISQLKSDMNIIGGGDSGERAMNRAIRAKAREDYDKLMAVMKPELASELDHLNRGIAERTPSFFIQLAQLLATIGSFPLLIYCQVIVFTLGLYAFLGTSRVLVAVGRGTTMVVKSQGSFIYTIYYSEFKPMQEGYRQLIAMLHAEKARSEAPPTSWESFQQAARYHAISTLHFCVFILLLPTRLLPNGVVIVMRAIWKTFFGPRQ